MESLQSYERDLEVSGFCILDHVVPPEACGPLEERLLEVASQHRNRRANKEQRVSFVPGVINYDQSFAPYLADARVLALTGTFLGPNVRISFTSALINDPGKERTTWHADWPFNQSNACHVPAPYPDRIMHMTGLIMISPFTEENGGTLVVPGSHRYTSNPTNENLGIDPYAPHPTEHRVTGEPGSMILFDSRLWHCPPGNPSNKPRVALGLRFAPWWLNIEPLDPDSDVRRQWVEEPGLTDNIVPRLPREVYDALPEIVQPLYRHWVERNNA